ncbi:hypothetical protein GMD41_12570 [Parasutterella excrementihominis]|uniref:hypothetical protein n=1 Tax=Parasutterella excrementihominis TaxID=487175 RepID=UPI0012BB7841|nr:hypothetical protein [Parasutterella excrementihominis]MTU33564.1 hypothetical protein [Parasutterella excrementihominis]
MTNPRDELIEAKVIREEDFALEAWRARVPFPEMRRRALSELGYAISESGLRALVKSARARVGDLAMTRDERIERQQAEIDERAARASFDLRKWHALAQEPQPDRAEYADTAEHRDALAGWAKRVEVANKAIADADRRLQAAMKDEREIYGDNAATKIEAEVTTRDGVLDDLNAALVSLGREPVEAGVGP